MTITIDPAYVTAVVLVALAAIGGIIWLAKLGGRVERLEQDVKDLKGDSRGSAGT